MAKPTTLYACTNCGAQSPKWTGRCLECGKWGTLTEEAAPSAGAGKQAAPAGRAQEPVSLAGAAQETVRRLATGIGEFDRVLGGGIVPGSLVLIGGEPGIGKSTLMLQVAAGVAAVPLYISGEESAAQIKNRAERLGVAGAKLRFLAATDNDAIIATLIKEKPGVAIIDSVQMLATGLVPSEAGSVAQIRACTAQLVETAKRHGIAIIITGHITKEGTLAGPKTLEHLVDTVIYLEQQAQSDFRILRTVKNRFGSTNEVGLFEMTGRGFVEISNPGGVFLDTAHHTSGTAIGSVMEGTRPFLVELQALATKTSFGYPQRKSAGFDLNRLQILLAVLAKRANVNLATHDVHINVVGGLRVTETSLDAALVAAIISSLYDAVIPKDTLVIGEIGLGGEIRTVHKLEARLKEAAKLGFTTALVPGGSKATIKGLKAVEMKTVGEAVDWVKRLK